MQKRNSWRRRRRHRRASAGPKFNMEKLCSAAAMGNRQCAPLALQHDTRDFHYCVGQSDVEFRTLVRATHTRLIILSGKAFYAKSRIKQNSLELKNVAICLKLDSLVHANFCL
jgi:hypothetical protein